TVLAIGPGASMHRDAAAVIRDLVRQGGKPIVLDADGLNAFAGHTDELHAGDRALILTPHPGELSRLNGIPVQQIQEDRIKAARDFALRCRAIVVLKGHRTIIADPEGNIWINTTGNAGMATAGTGDILTGLI